MQLRSFNLVRIGLGWGVEDQTTFLAKIDEITAEADALGMFVIYTFYTTFPPALTPMPTPSSFMAQWFSGPNGVTYNGQGGWAAMMSDFWTPLIQHTASHPSTAGYELWVEPDYAWASHAQLQAANQYFATQIRALCSQAIIIMGLGSDTLGYGGADITAVVPTGVSNIVGMIHLYAQSANCSGWLSGAPGWISSFKSVGIDNIIVGEWSADALSGFWPPPADVTNSAANTYVNTNLNFIKQNNLAAAYYVWDDTIGNPTCDDWLYLEDCNANPWWYTDLVGQKYLSILGPPQGGGGGGPTLGSNHITSIQLA